MLIFPKIPVMVISNLQLHLVIHANLEVGQESHVCPTRRPIARRGGK